MRIKVNLYSFLYLIIFFAILNAPLRLSDNGMTSFYRLLSIVPFSVIIASNCKKYKQPILFFAILLCYSTFVSFIIYKNISYDQIIFITYDFILFILIYHLSFKQENFDYNFFEFVDGITVATIAAAILQYVTNYNVPYVETSRGQPVGVYLSNGNELSSALCCVCIIYMFLILYKKKYKYLVHCFLILFISFINDAKLSMLGVIVSTLIMLIYRLYIRKKKRVSIRGKSFFMVIVIASICSIVALYLVNPTIKARDYSITIKELIFDAIFSIASGKQINTVGSIHDRTMAIIYGISELKNSCFLGIGAGNSIVMLQKPQYFLPFAKSMHNMIFQFLTEFGLFAVFIYIVVIKQIVKWFCDVNKSKIYLLKGAFTVGFIFISSQSSVGLLSNYYTIMMLIYVLLLKRENFHMDNKKEPL